MEMSVHMSRDDIRRQEKLLQELEKAERLDLSFMRIKLSSMSSGTKPIISFEFESHHGSHRESPDWLAKRREIFTTKLGEALTEYQQWLRSQMYLKEGE